MATSSVYAGCIDDLDVPAILEAALVGFHVLNFPVSVADGQIAEGGDWDAVRQRLRVLHHARHEHRSASSEGQVLCFIMCWPLTTLQRTK
ncbi:hypothetical protein V5799_006208 [Amblyomma americanum]|uniref:Uncharacterized protein n=1 Tax=Amblyomma americanum TaxID=6943 RepID=A0AAQ4DX22_AMBAM